MPDALAVKLRYMVPGTALVWSPRCHRGESDGFDTRRDRFTNIIDIIKKLCYNIYVKKKKYEFFA